MAQKFLTDIEVTRGLVDSSGDLGAAGQVLSSTGSGTNWITNEANSTVVYLDEFTGDNSTVDFTLSVSVTDENITQVYIDGVYQNKDTYSVSNTTLTFSTAPPLNADIEVITFSTATTADDLQAGVVIIPVKNTHTASIAKGEPVYITGNVGASARLQIAPADASNSAKMPAAGLLLQTLAVNAEGYVVTGGYLRNITTDTIDGTNTSSNDTVYVKSGGGLTMTKPTGTNLIQNIAKIARSSGGNSGSLLVSSILRTNDVPNITNDYFWLGNSSGVATPTEFTSSVRGLISTSGNALSYNSSTGVITSNFEESPAFTGNVDVAGNINTTGDYKADGNILIDTDTTYTTIRNPEETRAIFLGDSADPSNYYDNDQHYWRASGGGTIKMALVSSTGNVGIGTTSPSQKLEVRDGDITTRDASNTNYAQLSRYTGLILKGNGTGSRGVKTPNTDALTLGTNNTERMRIDSSGKVGIGVTPFANSLGTSVNVDLLGNGGILGYAGATYVNSNTYYNSGWKYKSNGTAAVLQVGGTSQVLTFRQAVSGTADAGITYTEAFRVHTDGNVGIGTTSPSHRLTIKSNTTSGGGGNLVLDRKGDRATHQNYLVLQSDNNSDELYLGTPANSSLAIIGARQSDLVFETGAYNERMRIDSSGNIGIGTTSPDGIFKAVSGTSPNAAQILIGYNSTSENYFDANTQIFRNGSYAEKMRITSSGYVGIGTTSPSQKLDVAGSGKFQPGIADGDALVTIAQTNSNAYVHAGLKINAGNTNPFYIYQSGSSNTLRFNYNSLSDAGGQMVIDSSGNVGIGTSSPSHKLQIDDGSMLIEKDQQSGGTDHNFIQLVYNGGWSGNVNGLAAINVTDGYPSNQTVGKFGITYDGSQGKFILTNLYNGGYGASGDVFTVRANGTTYMAGNVGIGTTSPADKFEVSSGNIRISNNSPILRFKDTDVTNLEHRILGGGNQGMEYSADVLNVTSGYHRWDIANSEKMRLIENGNLGINTTSPDGRLDVRGAISSGMALEDEDVSLTSTGGTPQATGILEISQGWSASTNNGDTIVFRHNSTSWKAWVLHYSFASTNGITVGVIGGYWNNSGASSNNFIENNLGASVAVTHGGTGNQNIIVTFTFTALGTHPLSSFKYIQHGGDGKPLASKTSITLNS